MLQVAQYSSILKIIVHAYVITDNVLPQDIKEVQSTISSSKVRICFFKRVKRIKYAL